MISGGLETHVFLCFIFVFMHKMFGVFRNRWVELGQWFNVRDRGDVGNEMKEIPMLNYFDHKLLFCDLCEKDTVVSVLFHRRYHCHIRSQWPKSDYTQLRTNIYL